MSLLYPADGYEISCLDDPCNEPYDGPEDPALWDSWVDDDCWTLGPDIPADANPSPFEPDPVDLDWRNRNLLPPPLSGGAPDEPSNQDWDEYARWADHLANDGPFTILTTPIDDTDMARVGAL